MESFFRMLDAQAILLIYLCIGFYCAKRDLIDVHTKQKLTDLILKITLPCMIFESFDRPLTPELLRQTFSVLAVAFMLSILSYLCGKVLYNRYPWEKKSILQYATLVNNCGFLGLPMVSAVYGSEGLLFASIFIIPNRIFMWTAGISVFTKADLKSNIKNILLNPCIITVFLGLARRILNIPVHEVIDTAVSNVGNVTTPLSMFVIGTMIVGVSIPSLFEGSIFYLSFVRLLALPLAALVILNLLHMPPLLTGVSLILTGMPAGSTSVLLAVKYGVNADYASRCVVMTTILSLITIPILMLFI